MSRAWQSLSPTVQATLLMLAAMAFFTSMSVFIRRSHKRSILSSSCSFATFSPLCCWRLGSRESVGMDCGFDAGVWSFRALVQCRRHGGRVHCDHFDTTRAGDRTRIHRPALDDTRRGTHLGRGHSGSPDCRTGGGLHRRTRGAAPRLRDAFHGRPARS